MSAYERTLREMRDDTENMASALAGITELEVDPTGLLPGDTVVRLSDHDLSGCHCDVRVTVLREKRTA